MEQEGLDVRDNGGKPPEKHKLWKRRYITESIEITEVIGVRQFNEMYAWATVPEDASTRANKYFVVNVKSIYNDRRLCDVCVLIPFNKPEAEYIYFTDAIRLPPFVWETIRETAKKLYHRFFLCGVPYEMARNVNPKLTEEGHKCSL